MKEQKRYIERGDLKQGSHLEVSVYYTKGGMSYFTGQVSPRGYYISVRPVTLGNGMVSFDLFSGCKKLVLETNRYSDKQFSKAVKMSKTYEDAERLIGVCTPKRGISWIALLIKANKYRIALGVLIDIFFLN